MGKICENVSTELGAGEPPNQVAKATGFGDTVANKMKLQRLDV